MFYAVVCSIAVLLSPMVAPVLMLAWAKDVRLTGPMRTEVNYDMFFYESPLWNGVKHAHQRYLDARAAPVEACVDVVEVWEERTA